MVLIGYIDVHCFDFNRIKINLKKKQHVIVSFDTLIAIICLFVDEQLDFNRTLNSLTYLLEEKLGGKKK